MIKIHDLVVKYGKHTVLDHLNLSIKASTVHGLVGLNGSGKTTLLNTIYGIKKQEKGDILYHSAPVKRKDTGYLETVNYFYPRIKGKEYLEFFNQQNPAFDIARWKEFFELPLDKLIDDYSTGMKKKLAFLGVICLDREILVLDEPFNGVDMETVQKIKSLLLKLKSSKTIIITSHILESLLNICDSISYLKGGKIQFTHGKKDFNALEQDIFSVHQDKIDYQIDRLLK
jgi:ABC-2 type transport system ATP-binding protein